MSKGNELGQGCGIVLMVIAAFFVLAAIVGSARDRGEQTFPTPQAAAPAAPTPVLEDTPAPTPEAIAAATPVVSATPSGPETIHETYIVQPGDTLNRIAARFSQEAGHNVTVAAIVAANGISDPARIGVGQQFTIPVVVSDGTAAYRCANAPAYPLSYRQSGHGQSKGIDVRRRGLYRCSHSKRGPGGREPRCT